MAIAILNIIGLVLDIIGAGLLFMYGLPAGLTQEGRGVVTITTDETKAQARKYNKRSRAALVLLILGFLLQLAGNLFQLRTSAR